MVAKNQINAIARKFRLTAGEAAGCCQIIRSLNPKPGVSFSSREKLRYIIPDVTIVKFKDSFSILLNESMYPPSPSTATTAGWGRNHRLRRYRIISAIRSARRNG